MTEDPNNPAIDEDDELSTTPPNPIEDDLTTTVPNVQFENVWKMPAPVFRKTSGKLPQGYERDVMGFAGESPDPAVAPVTPAPIASSPEIKPKGSTAKLMLVILGLGAMIAFLIVFLTVIYFYFLRTGD